MGHRLTKDGLSPDPAKVKAISDMPKPDNKKAVERFLAACSIYHISYHS